MSKNVLRAIESVLSMIVGIITVTYTQDILMSIILVIPIGIAYSMFSKSLKKRNKKIN